MGVTILAMSVVAGATWFFGVLVASTGGFSEFVGIHFYGLVVGATPVSGEVRDEVRGDL